ncbi:hypothetical protein [Campylobacter insulaenigrae]|uniref:hypothetical protein n=1 Tax=Campylobacter insulaenigrae TaxID=260714 RepID=UPI00215344D5|nr:hypothetical protein [Campylobacter insulaenigrae]MCR6593630.1 hypothetical protein [Campylobacter insulaenigrae]
MQMIENSANSILFGGSFILAFFFQFLAYIGIQEAQVMILVCIFFFSAIVGFCRTLALGKNIRIYTFSELLSKILMLGIPFVFALGAKQIDALYYFVDYSFSFLILGEILSVMINIQCIKTRKTIAEVDIYNIAVEKIKNFSSAFLKTNTYIKDENEVKNNDKK